jgi:hypothetical protein
MAFSNPFARDSEGTGRNILTYKIVSLLSFLLQLIATIYYSTHLVYGVHSIFGMSNAHVTPFTPSNVFVTIYWVVLWLVQLVYISHLFSSDDTARRSAAAVGAHFVFFNILHFIWILLWSTSHPILSELVVILNFFNLTSAYYRYPSTTRAPNFVHLAVSALPLTFEFFLLFWNGAVMFHCHHSLVCRILANIAIWGIAGFAGFFLFGFNDFYVGFATSFLAAGLGVGQFFTRVVALQWPFAFAVMSLCFVGSIVVAVPGILGRNERRVGETAPLLHDA